MTSRPGQSLRILMISPQYHPVVGGYERAAERLSAALVKRGHQVTVIAERRDRGWSQSEVREGVAIRRLWCLYRPRLHMLTALVSLALFLMFRGRRFDIWHAHQYGMHAGVAVALGFLMRRPVVLKLTSSGGQGLAQALAATRFSRLLAALHRRVDAVVALTRETEREAQAFGISPARIHVLGNGVDTERFRPRDEDERRRIKRRLGLDAEHLVVFVGRLSPEKNVEGLLRAWVQARPLMGRGWTLLIIGDGPERRRLEDIVIRENLDGSVLLLGAKDSIDDWMGVAEIYVSTSDREGLSNTLLEAMASGLAVAATRVSGVSELIEEPGAGLTVEVGNMRDFALALATLGGDQSLRDNLGARGHNVIQGRYSVEAVAERHEFVYRKLLSGGGE